MTGHRHRQAPRDCPVCGDELLLTRLTCEECDTELSGVFQACEFCALGAADRELLRVFLASRGNLKDLQRHLEVSYPTARARFAELLERLGIEAADEVEPAESREERDRAVAILEALASGELDADEAARQLEELA
ncbi:MAG: DUF2089 domain-containing protein [Actinobacteria bacterium]|nr:DUF2089 domain-containing protein [Actinomycetota bacterium]